MMQLYEISKELPQFAMYPWHHGGADFIYPFINKALVFKKALEHESMTVLYVSVMVQTMYQ
jgi:hypothetical protein